jgi:hypothetical protein
VSNRRKLRMLSKTGGSFQRPKFMWSGQPGNRTTQQQRRAAEEEAAQPKLALRPKSGAADD